MKLTLDLELDTTKDEAALVHPRVAGALVDYAAAVIENNRVVRIAGASKIPSDLLKGEPPVGLAAGGKLTTAHGVTITERTIDNELRKAAA